MKTVRGGRGRIDLNALPVPPAEWRRTIGLLALIVSAALAVVLFWHWASRRPGYAILRQEPPARWIRLPEPANLNARPVFPRIATFRRTFTVKPAKGGLVVYVAGLRKCRLYLNGRPLLAAGQDAPWYKGQTVDLTSYLVPGTNELDAVVENSTGPPVFLLKADKNPALSTPAGWVVSKDGKNWFHPELAAATKPFPVTSDYPSAWRGLEKRWMLLFELALLGLGILLLERVRRRLGKPGPAEWFSPERFRWMVVLLYGLLCLHNLIRLPASAGFDAPAHYSYINFLLSHHRLPLATDGWQMFEPPLYYALGAAVKALAGLVLSAGRASGLVRLVSMACGAGMIEICFRSARLLFPENPSLQRIATAVGGLLPVSVYMSQYAGNEPLAGFLSALALYLGLRLIGPEDHRVPVRKALVLGAVLGLALLAKVTAVLLLAPLAILLYLAARLGGGSRRRAVGVTAVMAACCAAVSGWYYLRNWILLGRPFVGGWAARPGLGWWQDPGYRMAKDSLSFGQAILKPVYAAAHGFWDGLYSSLWTDGFLGSFTSKPATPFWNPSLLAGAGLLVLPLVCIVVWGVVRTLSPGEDRARARLSFLAACGIIYLSAMVVLYVSVPTYASAKAGYALALVPAIGLLSAYGAEGLLKHAVSRGALTVYLFCWLGTVYCTYWAR